ncbi:MAG: DUF5606 domain-containing protein [Prevotellaceae bacterium]|jgi:hypothetical protein|nr:DUF5606 domain-containing protein [Prevotellaceae bacterium]
MLKSILSISGKPGLFKLVSQGKGMLIVESLNAEKKRQPAYAHEKVTALSDIAIYTETEEVPLRDVLTAIKKKENAGIASLDPKQASVDELRAYMSEILPAYDRDRVRPSDIKKLVTWYNILINNGITDFELKEEEQKENEAQS